MARGWAAPVRPPEPVASRDAAAREPVRAEWDGWAEWDGRASDRSPERRPSTRPASASTPQQSQDLSLGPILSSEQNRAILSEGCADREPELERGLRLQAVVANAGALRIVG